jgi:hypothetical protein
MGLEAKHRHELVNRLATIYNSPGGRGGGMPFFLNTAEIEWQIEMSEKYGPRPASWPEDIKRAHRDAEDAKKALSEESKKRRK